MNGSALASSEELNGGPSIGSTLLFQLLNVSKALVEHERPWMVLRYSARCPRIYWIVQTTVWAVAGTTPHTCYGRSLCDVQTTAVMT